MIKNRILKEEREMASYLINGNNKFILTLYLYAALSGISGCSEAATLHVAESGDGSNGLSWETAFQSISAGLVQATTGDSIWVRSGTYEENLRIGKPLTLIGSFDGTETALEEWDTLEGKVLTIIDGMAAGSVIEVSASVQIERFELINGRAEFTGFPDGPNYGGGGILVLKGNSDLRWLVIRNSISTLTLNGDEGSGLGGGLFIGKANVQIRNCVIRDNEVGLALNEPHPGSAGGGIYISSGGNVFVADCVIARNLARAGYFQEGPHQIPVGGSGGGIFFDGDGSIFQNCFVNANQALVGEEMYCSGGEDVMIESCTIYQNIAWAVGPPKLRNCIVLGDIRHDLQPFNGIAAVSYSLVRGGYPGEGNIDADPLFVDPDNGNFRLQEGSPCIDSASTTGPATDLDGNPRPYDVPGVGRDGTGDEFDMGAYEFIPSPTPVPTLLNERSDINQSGKVDAKDVLILLADWKKVTGAI